METHAIRSVDSYDVAPHRKIADRWIQIVVAAYLVFLCLEIISVYSENLNLAWFNLSDEVAITGEVIRFSNGDIHQRFFDMPGTPLMLFGAVEWRLLYSWAVLQGFHGTCNSFSFQHLQRLTTLLRADNLLFFILSSLLLFRIVSKITNPFAGAAAATILLTNPSYDVTAVSLRVEPLAVCFLLASILTLTEFRSKAAPFCAGVLAGLAAAVRLHSITASLPILAVLLFRQTWGCQSDYPARQRRIAGVLGSLLFLASALLCYFFGLARGPFVEAPSLLRKACLALAVATVILFLLYLHPKSRHAVVNTMTPRFFGLLSGAAAGFLLGVPTIFVQYERMMNSLNYYSGPSYLDPVAMHLSLAGRIVSLVRFYTPGITPDILTFVLFILGAGILLLVPPFRPLWPYLAAGLSFFFVRPLSLVRAFHHVALWIPFFATVSIVPLAALFNALTNKWRRWPYLGAIFALAALLGLDRDLMKVQPHWIPPRTSAERLHNIESSRAWIQANTPSNSLFMVAYYCFGPEIFYSVFRGEGLTVPVVQTDHRQYFKWWEDQSQLKGRAGYACLTPQDIPFMKQQELRQAGDGIDPLSDPRFQPVQTFGQGLGQVFLLKFDFSGVTEMSVPAPAFLPPTPPTSDNR